MRTTASELSMPPNRIAIGRTNLLREFLTLCSAYPSGSLFFTAPFYDQAFLERLSQFLPSTRTHLEVVVRSDSAAADLDTHLRRLGYRNLSIVVSEHLHAKVYMFELRTRDFLAIIGSHNATLAATTINLEVGVFMDAKARSPEWDALFDLRESFRTTARQFQTMQEIDKWRITRCQ
jgi:phosphatidylserine/phosphatidylglycerophosphate/cardiolipin synthase-like enzyme